MNTFSSYSTVALAVIVVAIAGFLFTQTGTGKSTAASPSLPARAVGVADISPRADAVPTPIRKARPNGENKTVFMSLHATQVVGAIADGTTYEYWTYENQVPGPFMRVMEGDAVQIQLTHEHAHDGGHAAADDPWRSFTIESLTPIAYAHAEDDNPDDGHQMPMGEHMMVDDHAQGSAQDDGHLMSAEQMEHNAAGHGEHSIDLHSVLGPGGGAEYTRVGPNETKTFEFKAMRPGLYVYHCASPHVPSHIANGMYGLILVEPKGGLPLVDREFYVVQGELYTSGKLGEKGHQEMSKDKLLAEAPEYFVFNGRKGALTGDRALKAKVGETVRIFFGVSGQVPSNFHVIGEIFDKLYPEGDIVSPPHRNVQTTLVPAGGAAMVEFTLEAPGKYLLVDHALTRAIDRGAVGELFVDGPERPAVIKKL
ncbi:MAG: nitrite reductase, copper-containing [Parcubacteria group bacterium]|nr:nitrite reductase, copper-containing [Parcubacteria group bacterium]